MQIAVGELCYFESFSREHLRVAFSFKQLRVSLESFKDSDIPDVFECKF